MWRGRENGREAAGDGRLSSMAGGVPSPVCHGPLRLEWSGSSGRCGSPAFIRSAGSPVAPESVPGPPVVFWHPCTMWYRVWGVPQSNLQRSLESVGFTVCSCVACGNELAGSRRNCAAFWLSLGGEAAVFSVRVCSGLICHCYAEGWTGAGHCWLVISCQGSSPVCLGN